MEKNIVTKIESYLKKDNFLYDRDSLRDEENTELFFIQFNDFFVRIIIQEYGEFIQFVSTGYDWESKFKTLSSEQMNSLLYSLMKRNGLKKLCKWSITEENDIYLTLDFSLEDSEFTYKQYERILDVILSESDDMISRISEEFNKNNPRFEF